MVTPAGKYSEITALFCAGVAGDQYSYAKFLQSITPLITRIVAKKIPAADVEDVVQEILISIHKARHTYDGQRPVMPWITSITLFRITDHLRKYYLQMRNKTVDISDLEEILPDVTQEGGANEYIDELLEDVPENHKRILTLMHMEGYTAKEIGKQMDMNESAVKVAAHRAIKRIKKKFSA